MNIYIICTGNTCRSPMAEAILRSRNIPNVCVRSAGIHATNGMPISANAKTLIEEEGMPYTPTSRAITAEDIDWADVILTMTEAHKYVLLQSYPHLIDKIFTLKGYLKRGSKEDVHDPFGGNLATYRKTFNELTSLIEASEASFKGGAL